MSWSYNANLAAEKDQVRFHIRDTDEAAPLVQDEEISFLLTEHGSVYAAAAAACRNIALYFTRRVSLVSKETGIKDDMKERADSYRQMADDFDEQASRTGLSVFAGGISQSDKESRADNQDATAPAFRRDLHQSSALPDLSGVTTHS